MGQKDGQIGVVRANASPRGIAQHGMSVQHAGQVFCVGMAMDCCHSLLGTAMLATLSLPTGSALVPCKLCALARTEHSLCKISQCLGIQMCTSHRVCHASIEHEQEHIIFITSSQMQTC